MSSIIIEKISKSFKNKEIYADFSLTLEGQQVHAIVGPNGSGKTTLLRIITGLYEIDGGRVDVQGSHAMLLENDYLYEDKTGLENIRLFGLYFAYEPVHLEEYAGLLNMTKDLDRKVSTYSKGMKRKLTLLIVIMMNRDILFLDEITSGVDPISRVEIRKLIALLKNEGKMIVITSHDLGEIEKVADTVTMIQDGKLIFHQTISALHGRSLEELFIERGRK